MLFFHILLPNPRPPLQCSYHQTHITLQQIRKGKQKDKEKRKKDVKEERKRKKERRKTFCNFASKKHPTDNFKAQKQYQYTASTPELFLY